MPMLQLEPTCPKCGRHLIAKEGQYGEFLACPAFPMCKYTEPLWEKEYKIWQRPPDPEGTERYQRDCALDFPCSYSFRAWEAEFNEGIELPALQRTYNDTLAVIDERYVWEHPLEFGIEPLTLKELEVVQPDLKGELLYLRNKITDFSKRRKPKGKY